MPFILQAKPWITTVRIGILLVVWIVFTVILLLKNEKEEIIRQISIPVNSSKGIIFLLFFLTSFILIISIT